MDKHLDGAWDKFWIKSQNGTFIALHMKAFGSNFFQISCFWKEYQILLYFTQYLNLILVLKLWEHLHNKMKIFWFKSPTAIMHKGPFNNYVDKMRGGGGQKMSVFVHTQGINTVHAEGAGGRVKQWQNSVHVVVECPLNTVLCKAKQSRRMLGKFLRPYYLQILSLQLFLNHPSRHLIGCLVLVCLHGLRLAVENSFKKLFLFPFRWLSSSWSKTDFLTILDG